MNILIISGFLGAGKTTFIKELVRQTGREFVVLENEFGGLDIDSAELQESGLETWELTEGCICCSMKANFAASVLTIANTLAPDFLIVEPTGVGMLSSILENIRQIEYEKIKLLQPVTLIDPHSFEHYLETFDEFYKDQIVNASQLILSKSEDLTPARRQELADALRAMNPDAPIVAEHYSFQPKTWWAGLLQSAWDAEKGIIPLASTEVLDLTTFSAEHIHFTDGHQFQNYMNILLRGTFGRIYRAKGHFGVGSEWFTFDITDDRYTLVPTSAKEKAELVLIGQQLDKRSLGVLFDDLLLSTALP